MCFRCSLSIDQLIKMKAAREGIPGSEVKIKLAIPRPDGKTEVTKAEIEKIRLQAKEVIREFLPNLTKKEENE